MGGLGLALALGLALGLDFGLGLALGLGHWGSPLGWLPAPAYLLA